MDDFIYWLWFSKVDTLTIRQKNALLKSYQDPETLFSLNEEALVKTGIFRKKNSLEKFLKSRELKTLAVDLSFLKRNDIQFIPFNDVRFPQKLRDIYSPPVGIYVKGNVNLLNHQPSIAVVGSRSPSKAALRYADSFSKTMSAMGITIISGLAEGVDGQAHWGSLKELGSTIAVLGNGLDQCYPARHEKLFREIAKKGLLISEFNLGDKPLGYHFPMRNRLISGLSEGVLVIEARKKSGSLITVNHALDQGKSVYVIPGEIENPHWAGGNALLKEGAKFVTEAKDIVEDYIVVEKNPKLGKKNARVEIEFSHPDDKRIYKAILKGYDNVDELVATTGINVVELSTRLTMMEIDEQIKCDHGKIRICHEFS